MAALKAVGLAVALLATSFTGATDAPPYDAEITTAAHRFDLPQNWIKAVITAESGGDANAVSVSRVSFGQERALLVWQRLIRPDGASLQLDNLPASNTQGRSGLSDEVDFHTGRLLKGIAMATLLGAGTELTFGEQESDLVQAVRESVQQNSDRASQRLVERNLDIQPTLTVRPGWPLRVIVRRDVVFR